MSRSAPYTMRCRTVHTSPLLSGSRENHGPNDRSGDGNRTVTQMLWTSVGQMQVAFWCALRPYLLENQSRIYLHLQEPHTLWIPKGSQGRGEMESGAAPYSVDKCPEEGLRAPQRSAEMLCIKEGQNAVRFSCLDFCRLNANWEKDKMLSIFPFQFSMGKCRD